MMNSSLDGQPLSLFFCPSSSFNFLLYCVCMFSCMCLYIRKREREREREREKERKNEEKSEREREIRLTSTSHSLALLFLLNHPKPASAFSTPPFWPYEPLDQSPQIYFHFRFHHVRISVIMLADHKKKRKEKLRH